MYRAVMMTKKITLEKKGQHRLKQAVLFVR
jgi:hypothetical protein